MSFICCLPLCLQAHNQRIKYNPVKHRSIFGYLAVFTQNWFYWSYLNDSCAWQRSPVDALYTRLSKQISISLCLHLDQIISIFQVKPNKAKWVHFCRETESCLSNLNTNPWQGRAQIFLRNCRPAVLKKNKKSLKMTASFLHNANYNHH